MHTVRFRAVSHRKRPYTAKLRLKIRLSVVIGPGNGKVDMTLPDKLRTFYLVIDHRTRNKDSDDDEKLPMTMQHI
jgi:hypothetical protein